MRLRLFTVAAAIATAAVAACGGSDSASAPDIASTTFAASLNVNLSQMTRTSSGLYLEDSVAGTGATAANDDVLFATYIGWLPSGTQFDTDVGKTELSFSLGAGQVIPGWDQGLVNMKVGGWRKLVIPPALGYGTAGNGTVPGNAILIFNVRLDSLHLPAIH